MKLTDGSLLLLNGKTGINCVGCFKSFRITPNGLVQIENKNLTTSQVLYTGAENLSLIGKTLPNNKVTIFYGDISKIVKSNSNGRFSLEIPFKDTQIGKEVRVFVNNENNDNLIVKYDSKLININTNRIEILNNTNLPIFNIAFNPLHNELNAVPYIGGMTYTGAFFENALNIKLINPQNGSVIYSFTGNKLNNISNFIATINNKKYNLGDIIEVSYNPKFVKANVYDEKGMIGNTNGSKEYFKITNKGLIKLNDKFIHVKPVDILSSKKITSTNIEGKAKPNTDISVSVNGVVFTRMTNKDGIFSIPIHDKNGFNSDTDIVISATGYIPTHINPTIESNIDLQNNYINFYNSQGSYGQLASSITFNPIAMKFVVDNYTNSFGNGKSHYFNFDLYNNTGKEILNTSINNGTTTSVTKTINNKSYNYGDIIGLSYNSLISKPIILNGNKVLGNLTGEKEYFEITKSGLVPVKFGQSVYTNNIYWNDKNLIIDGDFSAGQDKNILNAKKRLVLLNADNQIISTVNVKDGDNPSSVQVVIGSKILSKLDRSKVYTFALEVSNKMFPIKVGSNTPSNQYYLLEESNNNLSIAKMEQPIIVINNSNEISDYLNSLNSNIQSYSDNINLLSNHKLTHEIIAREFITRVGVNNLERLYNKSDSNKEFINWVLNNNMAMEEYLDGTNSKGINFNSLQIWSDIWNKYTNSRLGFNLKLAIATAISNANPIMAWPSTHYYGYGDTMTVGSPVDRYNIFETLNAEGGMLPIFKTLDVRHLEYIVNTYIPNSQIMELRDIIMQNHNGYLSVNEGGLSNIAYTINYEEHNPHTGQSVFSNSDFYGKNPNIANVWYDGGVCYSISHLGAAACQVFGIPAQPTTQDAGEHEAFIYYNNQHKWNLGNNIFGWSSSIADDISGWSNGIANTNVVANYDLLYENIKPETLKKSNEYLWLANAQLSYKDKINAINEAIKVEPLNVKAWLDKIDLMESNKNTTVENYINLSNEIIDTFKNYPMPMYDILLQIKNKILNIGTPVQYDNYIKSIKKSLDLVKDSTQRAIAQNLLKSMKGDELIGTNTPLSISKIIINNAWNQPLGTLGFNPINMTMNVTKGGAIVNPYLHGKAFTIGLYTKNNILIKKITLDGGEYPGSSLYNTFNNVGFKYGDKIYIDYETSSKISAVQLYKDGFVKESNINKSSVLEITARGLVYIGDNLKNSSTLGVVNVNTIYDNGSAVKGSEFNYKEIGNIGTLIEKSNIPRLNNYHINYVTINEIKCPLNEIPKYYLGQNMKITYHMAKNISYTKASISEQIVTSNGDIITPKKIIAKGLSGEKIEIKRPSIPMNYHLVKVLLNNKVISSEINNKVIYILPNEIPNKNEEITYVIAKNETKYKVEVACGNEIFESKVTEGVIGAKPSNLIPNIPKGYIIHGITVNGHSFTEKNVPKIYGNKNIEVIYNIFKIPTGEILEKVVTNTGKVLVKEYKIASGEVGTLVDIKLYNPRRGYSIEAIEINGKTYNNENMQKDLPKEISKGKTLITYVIRENYKKEKIKNSNKQTISKTSNSNKDNKGDIKRWEKETNNNGNKVKQGEVIIKVINQNRKVIEEVIHRGIIGFKFNPIDIPNKDKIISVILNGEKISSKTTINKIESNKRTHNKTIIIYNVEVPHKEVKYFTTGKVIIKVIDQNGKVIKHLIHEGRVGNKFNEISIPKTDKILSIFVNGDRSKKVPDSIVKNSRDNTTTIIYNVDVPKANKSVKSNDRNDKKKIDDNHDKGKKAIDKLKDKNGIVKIEVICKNGKVLYESQSSMPIGSNISNPTIPEGYKIESIISTVNGTTINNVPRKVKKGKTIIIYDVKEINNVVSQFDNKQNEKLVHSVVNKSKNDEDKVQNEGITNGNLNKSDNLRNVFNKKDEKSILNNSIENGNNHIKDNYLHNVDKRISNNLSSSDENNTLKILPNTGESSTTKEEATRDIGGLSLLATIMSIAFVFKRKKIIK